ncbi:histidine kinase [Halogeometricum borinquense]|uniref:Histidine kinase n=1 Tax=Halogeometricum borinquense TaxID=60847 RepID=A0A482TNZ4_9EURY|nr:histidine kinase [Halogeometricum borinquense]RYJ14951.1 histidine kinase [Halogeometricum borinquense]
MNRSLIAPLLVAFLLATLAVAPAAAVGPDKDVDECQNASNGPAGDAGPPAFVSGLVNNAVGSLSDLFASLPVPNFVKGFFGASTC